MTHPLLAAAVATPTPVAVAASSGPSWTEQLAAIAAAVAAGATLLAATAAITALIFARRAARAAGQQVTAAQAQVDAAKAQVTAAQAQVAAAQEQTRQAAELEWQRSQPYVVVYAEHNPVSIKIVDVVIANHGATAAYDVRVVCEPELVRTTAQGDQTPQEVGLPEVVPFLAPGQRWSTFWDAATARQGSSLPDRFEVTITYTDSREQSHASRAVLDWGMFGRILHTDVYGLHHAAQALRGIEESAMTWAKGEKVMKVATYDGPLRDKHLAAEGRRRQRGHEKVQRLLGWETAAEEAQ